MSIIKIEDIAFVRFAAPDLDEMRSFLTQFGLDCFDGQGDRLYAKGRDGAPFVHSTEHGDPAFRGLGLRAQSVQDLQLLAAAEGVAVKDFAAPGGGKVVRLTDPDGVSVEVVAGQTFDAPQPLAEDIPPQQCRWTAPPTSCGPIGGRSSACHPSRSLRAQRERFPDVGTLV